MSSVSACPRAAHYAQELAQQREYLRTLPAGSRYPAEKDEAAFVRLRDAALVPHDCAVRDCAFAAHNLKRGWP